MKNIAQVISGIYFLIGGVAYIYLWSRHQSIGDLLYGVACLYVAIAAFNSKLPKVITMIVTAWLVIDQISLLTTAPIRAVVNILCAMPMLLQSWGKNTDKNAQSAKLH